MGVFLWADAMYMGRKARTQLSASRNVRLVLGATVTGLRTDDDMRAVTSVLADGRVRTRDIGGTASTTAFADEICRALDRTAA